MEELRRQPILVVDDDPDVRGAMSGLLESRGYRAISAANGREALASLRSADPPGVVLLDLMMPITEGEPLQDHQTTDAQVAVIPVIAFSPRDEIEQKALSLQAAAYLRKPVDTDELLEAVGRYYPRT